jgi:glycerol transport system ATP-binding protein
MPVKGRLSGLPMAAISPGSAQSPEIEQHAGDAMAFHCTIAVTEITGSETFIHLDHHGDRWVGLIHGVHGTSPSDRSLRSISTRPRLHLCEDGTLVAARPMRAA